MRGAVFAAGGALAYPAGSTAAPASRDNHGRITLVILTRG
jgi:hypothetical protein